jgi:hypothetical protein
MSDMNPIEDAPRDGEEFVLFGSFGPDGTVLRFPRARRAPDFDFEVKGGSAWVSVYGRSTVPFKALGWKPLDEVAHD